MPAESEIAKEEAPTTAAEQFKATILERDAREDTATPVEKNVLPPMRDEKKLEEETGSEQAISPPNTHGTDEEDLSKAVDGEETDDVQSSVPVEQKFDESVEDQPSQEDIEKVVLSSPTIHPDDSSDKEEREDAEEDGATRRKRIAERIAKTGGFNPFSAPPPPRRLSSSSTDIAISPSSRKHDGLTASPPPIPGGKPSARKSSGDSHKSGSAPISSSTGSSHEQIPSVIRRGSSDSGFVRSPALSPSLGASHVIQDVSEEPEDILEDQNGK